MIPWDDFKRLDSVTQKRLRMFCWQSKQGVHAPKNINQLAVQWHLNHSSSPNVSIDFHHSLLRGIFPDTEVHDMSDWIESWPTIHEFYDAYMTLCIRDCMLLEGFRTEGSDRELTELVFMPAFHHAVERFGVKPLIVTLEPVSGPLDWYWYSYPAELMPMVEWALMGGNYGT